MVKSPRLEAIEQGGLLGPHKIALWCSKCRKLVIANRENHDYPEAVMLEFDCPDCGDPGDFESLTYYDRNGNEVLYDVALIGTPEHPLAECMKAKEKTP